MNEDNDSVQAAPSSGLRATSSEWTLWGAIGQAVAMLGIASLLALVIWKWNPKAPALYVADTGDRQIEAAAVMGKFGRDVLWIDARPEAQYLAGHMPGAIRLGADEVETLLFDHFEALQAESRPMVIYCGAKKCAASHRVSAYLEENMFIQAWVLTGGWDALVDAGLASASSQN